MNSSSIAARLSKQFCASPVFWALTLAALVRIIVFVTPSPNGGGDSARFLYQAEALLNGRGFLWDDVPCTDLPPGYPVFLALLRSVSSSLLLVVFVQFVLSVLSCYLIYLAIRPRSERLAIAGLLAYAAYPWVAYLNFRKFQAG